MRKPQAGPCQSCENLRKALILLLPANDIVRNGGTCWCHPSYDVAKYGHSIACACATEALVGVPVTPEEMDEAERTCHEQH